LGKEARKERGPNLRHVNRKDEEMSIAGARHRRYDPCERTEPFLLVKEQYRTGKRICAIGMEGMCAHR
jgi:hypothetical protein